MLEKLTYLPEEMEENSGLQVIPGSDLVWIINDSGNKDHLYGLTIDGKIQKDINIKGASNRDWEDLAADEEGNIYIADIGNNNYNRDELQIYKVPNPTNFMEDDLRAEEIEFTYANQKKEQPFNAEALLYYKERLYIFTKNGRKLPKNETRLFSVPATPGKHKAELVGIIPTCDDTDICRITAADISPDGRTIALLGYQKIWIAPNFLEKDSIPPLKSIDLEHRTQKEGLCFADNQTLYISDERNITGGGILYRFSLDSLEMRD